MSIPVTLVADARVGYRRKHIVVQGTLPDVRGPLPPETVMQLSAEGLGARDEARRRERAGLVLAYLMLNRPGAAANVCAQDLHLTPGGFQVQVPEYKMGILKRGARSPLPSLSPRAAGTSTPHLS
eukprot:contig_11976_g2850